MRGDAGDGFRGVGTRAGDEVKSAGALAVEPEVLGERLCHTELEPFRNKVTYRPCVIFETARCETLIGAVEEGKMLFGADELGELDPLGPREIHTGWVMGTGMEQYDTARLSLLDGGIHAGKVEPFCFRREIRVCSDGEIHVGEDLVVIGPCGRREINRLVGRPRIEFRKEESTQMEGTRTRDGLDARYLDSKTDLIQAPSIEHRRIRYTYALLSDCRTVCTKHYLLCRRSKIGKACDG